MGYFKYGKEEMEYLKKKDPILGIEIDKIEIEAIQKCGMSMRKADYIKGISSAAILKTVDFDNLHKLKDKDVIKELVNLNIKVLA